MDGSETRRVKVVLVLLYISVSTRSLNIYTWSRILLTLTWKLSSPALFMFICSVVICVCSCWFLLVKVFFYCLTRVCLSGDLFITSLYRQPFVQCILQYICNTFPISVSGRSYTEYQNQNGFSYGKYCMKTYVNVQFLNHAQQPTA